MNDGSISINGWNVFNNTSATTTNNLIYTTGTWIGDNTTYPVHAPPIHYGDPLLVEAGPKPKDPLTWLHERVGEICDLGRLQ